MVNSQTIVVTGATGGLGRLAARELACGGAHLVLIARNAGRAERTLEEITAAAPGAKIDIFFGDFTRIDDVRRVGQEIAARYGRVDTLVNNAGIHAFSQRVTEDGFPEMVAVNHLAPFVLTSELLDALRKSPAARIVNVASEASRNHGTLRIPEDLTDTTPFTTRGSSQRYGKTKLMNVMFTKELARRLEGTGVTANCLNPGFNVTGLGRELRGAQVLERALGVLHIGDPSRGANLIVSLCTEPRFAAKSGRYITVKGQKEIIPAAPGDDAGAQAELWAATEAILGEPRQLGESGGGSGIPE